MKTPILSGAVTCALLIFCSSSAQALAQEEGGLDRDLRAETGVGEPVEMPRGGFFSDPADPRALTNQRVREARVVHPITAPNFSEDPYITTDIRGTYVNQQFPRNDLFNGGAARVYDFQGRFAVNEDLQFLISQLGSADVTLQGNEDYGLRDIALGFKYSVLKDWDTRQHAAVGATVELGIGDDDVLSDDYELRLFSTFAQGIGAVNVSGSANVRFAMGNEDALGDSDVLSLHLHADTAVTEQFSPVVELNYYKVLSEGDNVTPFSGGDLANLGGSEDEDILTVGVGGEARVIDGVALRLAYESPLTDDEDLFGYRWTASAVWRF